MLSIPNYPLITKWIVLVLLGLAFTLGSVVVLKETAQRLITQVQPDDEELHPLPPIQPRVVTPDGEDEVVTFFHLTHMASAQAILRHGLQPVVGARSGNDTRFFAITETIFEEEAFPIVNQHKTKWYSQPYR
jgi:hypothetical protein